MFPLEGAVNATVSTDVLDNCGPSTLFDAFGVEKHEWLAQGPDLNPNEHLWGKLEC